VTYQCLQPATTDTVAGVLFENLDGSLADVELVLRLLTSAPKPMPPAAMPAASSDAAAASATPAAPAAAAAAGAGGAAGGAVGAMGSAAAMAATERSHALERRARLRGLSAHLEELVQVRVLVLVFTVRVVNQPHQQ
jgi:hypothetical protein